jgi:hypothetical protein
MTVQRAAVVPLVVFGGVLSWWGWKSGGYFEVVFLPGTMILLGLVALLLLFAPGLVDFRGPALVSLVALGGLVAWTLFSGIWSAVPAVAFSDAERAIGYVGAFVIGAWTCVLLGRRALLSLGPLAVAGALVGFVTLLALWTGNSSHDFFETDATLRYPIGYRNAEAAFFLMALLPAIVLCSSRDLSWPVRGVFLGSSTLMIELAILAQSRASVFAFVIAVTVLIIAHPDRLRVLGWLVLAAIPAAVALPWLLDVFQRDAGNTAAEIHPLHRACVAMAITTAVSLAVGCLGARLGSGYSLPDRARKGVGRGLLTALGVVLLVAVVALLRSDGGPGGFVSRHVDQLTAGTPNLESQGSRFGLNVSSDRGEFWRVALHDFDRHPLDGEGAGGFRASYLLHGKTGVQPEDPHSIEMLMISELGVPGALLMLAFLGGGLVAVIRARRLGPEAATLAAGAFAIGAYWFAHASVDWFWSYAAITLPVPFVIGAAAAPALRREEAGERTPIRTGLAVAAGVLAVLMLPFFFSERDTDRAIRTWRSDLSGAYTDLDNAADLNPWTSRPLEAKAAIANANGDRAVALSAVDEGIKRTPKDWLLYYLKAQAQGKTDLAGASESLARAHELSPNDPEIGALGKRLGVRN